MRHILLLTLVSVLSFSSVIPSAAAYNGYVSDTRAGEHPYEARSRDERLRKRLAKEAEIYGAYRFDSPLYYDPIYAKRSALHPFYRKGGTSRYIDYSRAAAWQGYINPAQEKKMSPERYCTNYTYTTVGSYAGAPVGYQCY